MNKNSIVKGFASLFISLIIVLSVCIPAFADNGTIVININEYKFVIDDDTAHEEKYDARNENIITAPKYQPGPDCWVYAGVSAIETDAVKSGLSDKNIDLSENFITYFAAGQKGGDTCSEAGGDTQRFCTVAAACNVFANESDFPASYKFSEEDRFKGTSGLGIGEKRTLYTLGAVKDWIKEHGSAVLTVGSLTGLNSEYIYHDTKSDKETAHAVCIIGWDDTYSFEGFNDSVPGPGAFIIKNSYGTEWGTGGYGYVSYYDASISDISGLTAKRMDENEVTYTYNQTSFSGPVVSTGKKTTVNAYKINQDGKIDSYTFTVSSKNVTVSTQLIINGEEKFSTSANTYTDTGLFRINVEDIAVKTDDIVEIAVTYSSNSMYLLYMENNGNSVNYSHNPGESYYKNANGETTPAAGNFFINLNVVEENNEVDNCAAGNFFATFFSAIANFFNNIVNFFKEVFNVG